MRCPADAPVCASPSAIPAKPSIVPPSQPPPSRLPPTPSQVVLSSQSAPPSARPTIIAAASAAPTSRPSLRPAATKYLRATMSPAPSRSAPPASFTPVAYIPVLNSAIRIAGANATTATEPAALQRTQANLACAIGVPQQNIQIRNVTVVYSNGTRFVLPFDPAVPQLNSGNDVVCLAPMSGAVTGVRRLQQVTYTIEISYDIVDPPLVMLSMDGATFAASLSNTTAMGDLVLALQGTGITVEAPPELVLGLGAAPSPSSQPVTITTINSQISQGPLLYGVIGAIVGAIVILGVVVAFVVIRLQSTRPTIATPSAQKTIETKIVYVVENPMGTNVAQVDESLRNNFNPTGVRRTV